jgi:Archaeal/vacuolar-type H+-ATPase subunit I
MIKKMTKYSFVIFHREVDDFLQNLQNIGVVDVTRQKRAIDGYSKDQFELIAKYNATIKQLNVVKEEAKAKKIEIPTSKPNAENLLEHITNSLQKKIAINNEIATTKTALVEAKPWGNFTQTDFDKLVALNLKPHFYCITKKRFNEQWAEEYPLHIISETESNVYFAILQEGNSEYTFKEQEAHFPDESFDVLDARRVKLEEDKKINENAILSCTSCIKDLEEEKQKLFSKLDLYLASSNSTKEAEDTIAIFEGFAPTDIDKEVDKFLEDNNVYYLKEAAKTEDNPPIKLKNNFFGKLYEPIGELYMLPTYGELDLTLFFAPFYMLFFGLCLGDMGYGLILLIAGLVVNFTMPKFKNYGKLVAWLGFGAVIMPALNGTFFGAKLYDIFPMPENIKSLFFSDMKMFWFAIIFGLVQIVFARIINAIFTMKTQGFFAGLANLGWAILITWGAVWYASTQVPFSYPDFVNYIGLGALALILFFTSDSKNPIIRLFKGTASLYDVTGVFGDMLSYIRLFGLGTAGGILGLVVNSVAMQLSGVPYIGWGLTIIMLLVGHTAVLFLSTLGAFVHPMRLTFVEFYKNAGFQGGGREYSPLTKNKE